MSEICTPKTFRFTEDDRLRLLAELGKVNVSPYADFAAFDAEIDSLSRWGSLPDGLYDIVEGMKADRAEDRHAHYLVNCPIDETVPYLDHENPVADKLLKKRTFVSEAFLQLLMKLLDNPPLAYETRNDGHFFHDVLSQAKYTNTQTQKTDGELYYHNDRTAHPIRADYLLLLGLRCPPQNEIVTTYTHGRHVLDRLPADVRQTLSEPLFVTPFDLLSRDSNRNHMESEKHTIIEEETCLRYYDQRTIAAADSPARAAEAVLALRAAIEATPRVETTIENGGLFCFPNKMGLHSRQLRAIRDQEAQKERWLLKAYSFRSSAARDRFRPDYVDRLPGLVREAA
ncbi:MAG TPA: TauD/TfdA family dioxygenase [Stellaceae bacterium]